MLKAASHRDMQVQECMNCPLQEPCVDHSLEFGGVNLNAETQKIDGAGQRILRRDLYILRVFPEVYASELKAVVHAGFLLWVMHALLHPHVPMTGSFQHELTPNGPHRRR